MSQGVIPLFTDPTGRDRRGIVCLSRASNPYLRLLYNHLEPFGFPLAPTPDRLSLAWLWSRRKSVGFLHFHWPEGQYRWERGPHPLRGFLSWAKLGLFTVRLASARLLRYRLVWTIHQPLPHETTSRRLDRAAARVLARASRVLVVHDRATLGTAARELGQPASGARIVPHGSYVDVYPSGRGRDEARAALGLDRDTFAFLLFGQVRQYKDIEVVLEAFEATALPNATLVVAGPCRHPELAAEIEAAARRDERIRPMLEFIEDDRVAELFAACDAAVVARGDGGTSGSLILALSLGAAVVFADTATYRELAANGDAGWPFRAGDSDSLRAALEEAARDGEAGRRGQAGLRAARKLEWSESAALLAGHLEETLRKRRSTTERTGAMERLMRMLAWLEGRAERVIGAVLRGTMAVLVRVLRRGRYRAWRRTQGA